MRPIVSILGRVLEAPSPHKCACGTVSIDADAAERHRMDHAAELRYLGQWPKGYIPLYRRV